MDRNKTMTVFKIKKSWSSKKYYKYIWATSHHTIPTNFRLAGFKVKEF